MRPSVHRINSTGANASQGRVTLAPVKALWNGGLILCTVAFAPATFSFEAVIVFLITTYGTLLLGHSVGMHRRLIHQSFDCPKWLERILVYFGVLVGMPGPFGILRIHDIRDWAQREEHCHDFFAHRRSLWLDAFWQLACRFEFKRPPVLEIEPEFGLDRWYQWMERTWMLQQLPLAAILFLLGDWSWVVWGVCVRVSVSVIGHWVVTYYTHNPGPGRWIVLGAGVQASNLPGFGLLTMGECWHNNHHAFPESARIGLLAKEFDPAWWVIRFLQRVGVVTRVGIPRAEWQRQDVVSASYESWKTFAHTRW